MKLTEKQLADIFTNSTKSYQAQSQIGDCLNSTPASATRINQVEDIINDHNSAQAFKMASGFKPWSDAVAQSIQSSQKSWISRFVFNSPLKTAVATMAFAFAFVVAIPQFNQNSPTVIPIQNDIAKDHINSMPFEGQSDVLSTSGFDSSDNNQDKLFGANFG